MTSDDVVYTYNFIVTNDKNRRHKKLASWLKSIEKTGKYSVRFNLNSPYANLFNDLYRIKIRKNGIMELMVIGMIMRKQLVLMV